MRGFQRFLEVFRGFQRFSEVFKGLSQTLSECHFLSELWVMLSLIVLPLKTPARRLYFAFAFVMGRQINSPRFSFAFAFAMIMLGTHKPQQQATHTKSIKIPEILTNFRFRNLTAGKSKYPGTFIFSLVFVSVIGEVQGATRIWATGLRASEREICL